VLRELRTWVDTLPSGDCAAPFSGASCPPWRSAPRVAVAIRPASVKVPTAIPTHRARLPISRPPISHPPISRLLPRFSPRAPRWWKVSRYLRRRRRIHRMRPNLPLCSMSSLNIRRLRHSMRRPNMRRRRLNMRRRRLSMRRRRLSMRLHNTHPLRNNFSRPNLCQPMCRRHRDRRLILRRRSAPAAIGTGEAVQNSPMRPSHVHPLRSHRFQLTRVRLRPRCHHRRPHRRPCRCRRLSWAVRPKLCCRRRRYTRWRQARRWGGWRTDTGSAPKRSPLQTALHPKLR
jgi:hypothetical protein